MQQAGAQVQMIQTLCEALSQSVRGCTNETLLRQSQAQVHNFLSDQSGLQKNLQNIAQPIEEVLIRRLTESLQFERENFSQLQVCCLADLYRLCLHLFSVSPRDLRALAKVLSGTLVFILRRALLTQQYTSIIKQSDEEDNEDTRLLLNSSALLLQQYLQQAQQQNLPKSVYGLEFAESLLLYQNCVQFVLEQGGSKTQVVKGRAATNNTNLRTANAKEVARLACRLFCDASTSDKQQMLEVYLQVLSERYRDSCGGNRQAHLLIAVTEQQIKMHPVIYLFLKQVQGGVTSLRRITQCEQSDYQELVRTQCEQFAELQHALQVSLDALVQKCQNASKGSRLRDFLRDFARSLSECAYSTELPVAAWLLRLLMDGIKRDLIADRARIDKHVLLDLIEGIAKTMTRPVMNAIACQRDLLLVQSVENSQEKCVCCLKRSGAQAVVIKTAQKSLQLCSRCCTAAAVEGGSKHCGGSTSQDLLQLERRTLCHAFLPLILRLLAAEEQAICVSLAAQYAAENSCKRRVCEQLKRFCEIVAARSEDALQQQSDTEQDISRILYKLFLIETTHARYDLEGLFQSLIAFSNHAQLALRKKCLYALKRLLVQLATSNDARTLFEKVLADIWNMLASEDLEQGRIYDSNAGVRRAALALVQSFVGIEAYRKRAMSVLVKRVVDTDEDNRRFLLDFIRQSDEFLSHLREARETQHALFRQLVFLLQNDVEDVGGMAQELLGTIIFAQSSEVKQRRSKNKRRCKAAKIENCQQQDAVRVVQSLLQLLNLSQDEGILESLLGEYMSQVDMEQVTRTALQLLAQQGAPEKGEYCLLLDLLSVLARQGQEQGPIQQQQNHAKAFTENLDLLIDHCCCVEQGKGGSIERQLKFLEVLQNVLLRQYLLPSKKNEQRFARLEEHLENVMYATPHDEHLKSVVKTLCASVKCGSRNLGRIIGGLPNRSFLAASDNQQADQYVYGQEEDDEMTKKRGSTVQPHNKKQKEGCFIAVYRYFLQLIVDFNENSESFTPADSALRSDLKRCMIILSVFAVQFDAYLFEARVESEDSNTQYSDQEDLFSFSSLFKRILHFAFLTPSSQIANCPVHDLQRCSMDCLQLLWEKDDALVFRSRAIIERFLANENADTFVVAKILKVFQRYCDLRVRAADYKRDNNSNNNNNSQAARKELARADTLEDIFWMIVQLIRKHYGVQLRRRVARITTELVRCLQSLSAFGACHLPDLFCELLPFLQDSSDSVRDAVNDYFAQEARNPFKQLFFSNQAVAALTECARFAAGAKTLRRKSDRLRTAQQQQYQKWQLPYSTDLQICYFEQLNIQSLKMGVGYSFVEQLVHAKIKNAQLEPPSAVKYYCQILLSLTHFAHSQLACVVAGVCELYKDNSFAIARELKRQEDSTINQQQPAVTQNATETLMKYLRQATNLLMVLATAQLLLLHCGLSSTADCFLRVHRELLRQQRSSANSTYEPDFDEELLEQFNQTFDLDTLCTSTIQCRTLRKKIKHLAERQIALDSEKILDLESVGEKVHDSERAVVEESLQPVRVPQTRRQAVTSKKRGLRI